MFSGRLNNFISCLKQGQQLKKNNIFYKKCCSITPLLNKLRDLGFIYGYLIKNDYFNISNYRKTLFIIF